MEFQICDQRNDILADAVRVRLEGAKSDLHAADGRLVTTFSDYSRGKKDRFRKDVC